MPRRPTTRPAERGAPCSATSPRQQISMWEHDLVINMSLRASVKTFLKKNEIVFFYFIQPHHFGLHLSRYGLLIIFLRQCQ